MKSIVDKIIEEEKTKFFWKGFWFGLIIWTFLVLVGKVIIDVFF